MINSEWKVLPFRNASVYALSCITWCVANAWAGPAMAANCSAIPNSTLSTQNQVTNFQVLYGPCDTVSVDLIIESSEINDLSGLAGIETITGALLFYYPVNLPSLAGLEGLTQVGGLSIEGADLLTGLTGLQNLASIGSLFIQNNASLANLDGLPSVLPGVNNLSISGNPKMTSLDGMPAIAEITGLVQIGENALLANVTGMAASGFPTGDTPQVDISVSGNPSLTALAGLPPIDKVWSLGISENNVLVSLNGLNNLVEIWEGLTIVANPALKDCSVLATVLDEIDDGAPGPSTDPDSPPDSPGVDHILIEGNIAGCNSLGEILASGIFSDGFEAGSAPL